MENLHIFNYDYVDSDEKSSDGADDSAGITAFSDYWSVSATL